MPSKRAIATIDDISQIIDVVNALRRGLASKSPTLPMRGEYLKARGLRLRGEYSIVFVTVVSNMCVEDACLHNDANDAPDAFAVLTSYSHPYVTLAYLNSIRKCVICVSASGARFSDIRTTVLVLFAWNKTEVSQDARDPTLVRRSDLCCRFKTKGLASDFKDAHAR